MQHEKSPPVAFGWGMIFTYIIANTHGWSGMTSSVLSFACVPFLPLALALELALHCVHYGPLLPLVDTLLV